MGTGRLEGSLLQILTLAMDTLKVYIVKEILLFVTTWIDLEGIRLSKINQMERNKQCMISLVCEMLNKTVK